MPLPAQYVTCRFIYKPEEGKEMVLVHYYYPVPNLAGYNSAHFDAFLVSLDNGVGQELRNGLAADCDYLGVSISMNLGGVVFTGSYIAGSGAGAVVGDSLPTYAAKTIRKRTDVPGRTGYGRWFIGCVPEADTEDSRLNANGLTHSDDLGTGLAATIVYGGGAADMIPCHLSRKDDTLIPILATESIPVLKRQSRRALRPLL